MRPRSKAQAACASRDAVLKQKQVGCNGLPQSELQGKPMGSLAAPLPPDKQVLINPLVDKDSGEVVAVILVSEWELV
ncbi:cGMP-dependent 3',5'-cyclic phosphodiesterase [Chelonia mydas]|uniref:cGMP-dependent 3',5'-cyclic phosphodiesterase n=1 Tax=Chelonia mydas TaxID=8469 RepID=M7BGF6_CHEMY|nr:cGMP-dependent 3',5'-cyclic phosphodiesterase [Chelonia mydas]